MSAAPIDPLAFAGAALEDRGALVEREAGGLLAILPDDVSVELGLAQTVRLAVEPRSATDVHCGLGSALLERLVSAARSQVPIASVRVDADPPRAASARALGERFALRNGVTEVCEVRLGRAEYAVLWASWSAQADDRHDGLIRLVACAGDGGEPAPGLLTLPDPTDPQRAFGLEPLERTSGWERAIPFLAARVRGPVAEALEPIGRAVRRRHERDHERIAGYYAALARDALERKRRVEAAALDAKLAHLVEERDAKLRELRERFTLRTSIEPVAILLLDVPAAHVVLRVRRRKRERELLLQLPSGASALDLVACDGCLGPSARPLVCDDALHLVCERCLPSADGRPRCPACARPSSSTRKPSAPGTL